MKNLRVKLNEGRKPQEDYYLKVTRVDYDDGDKKYFQSTLVNGRDGHQVLMKQTPTLYRLPVNFYESDPNDPVFNP